MYDFEFKGNILGHSLCYNKALRHKEDNFMADKVELTKEQLTELTEYFKQNDFTKNMMLDREYNLNLEESKVIIKAKGFSVSIGSEI